jgi:hypothetical protein
MLVILKRFDAPDETRALTKASLRLCTSEV